MHRRLGMVALTTGVAVISVLPSASIGASRAPRLDAVLTTTTQAVAQQAHGVQAATATSVAHVQQQLNAAIARTSAGVQAATKRLSPASAAHSSQQTRAATPTPTTNPPLHGTGNHGQGTVAVVDLNPSNQRPLGGSPDGSDAGPEDVVAGRARGEQLPNGKYHGHITIAALFGKELVGVDSAEGQSTTGPLQPVQTAVLDPLCNGTAQQVCLSVLTANSSTTSTGSKNDFAVARAQLGGAKGVGVGAAESQGTITQDANCQTSTGVTKTANVNLGGGALANAANSSSTSRSCTGQPSQVTNTSQVIGLGGTNVPIPAAGCANGTPNTVAGIPAILPLVCNADAVTQSTGVREALDAFVLNVGSTSLVKETTAASESASTAPATTTTPPPPTTGGNPGTGTGSGSGSGPGAGTGTGSGSGSGKGTGSGKGAGSGKGNGSGKGSGSGPGSGGTGSGSNGSGHGSARPQCSDGIDNDGDGLIDAKDPDCHTDGNANNPASYNPNHDSEANSGGAVQSGSLPFTGVDVVGLALAGALLLAGGLVLRRKDGLLDQ